METRESVNFGRTAAAITYLQQHHAAQPDLFELAENSHLSPFHFQRLFTEWAGVSPKKFLQYISLWHAKNLLKQEQKSLFETALETGLSGTGRLHDLFVNIEAMTPGEYKNGDQDLQISYSFSDSLFGQVLVATTAKGICKLTFADQPKSALSLLKATFPNAQFRELPEPLHQEVAALFSNPTPNLQQIKLHLKGTPFQLKVWEALLKIPMGNLSTYGSLAQQIIQPKASRALGTAVGDNPVAYLIPCHRVIRATGLLGGYRWGEVRKTALIGWEAAKTNSFNQATLPAHRQSFN